MKLSKKTLVIAGLLVILLAAAGVGFYMMWKCGSEKSGSPGAEEGFESDPATKIEYYAMSGCPHCSAFDPVWSSVEAKVMADDSRNGLTMKKWDVKTDEGHDKAKDAGVTAFPHVQKTSPDGVVTVFNGKRTEEELLDFCK